MFDIGFWEIAVIGVIALLVVGPERLPGVARNVGRWVGRVRRYVTHVKQDIEREIHADEVRQLLEKPEGLESIGDVARQTASVIEDTRKELNSAVNEAQANIQEDEQGGSDWARSGASYESRDKLAEPAGEAQAERPIPHHAVDEDLFAPSNIAGVSPASDASPQADAEPASTSDSPADEQRNERPGQR